MRGTERAATRPIANNARISTVLLKNLKN